MLVWDLVARCVRYNFDKDRQGYDDFWLFPDESLSLALGDCEDSAILLATLLIAAGISRYCVRVVLGNLYDAHGTLLGGHAWTVYQDEWGIWRLLEATLDHIPSGLPAADALTMPGGRQIYWPEFCFNDAHLWWISAGQQPKRRSSPRTGRLPAQECHGGDRERRDASRAASRRVGADGAVGEGVGAVQGSDYGGY